MSELNTAISAPMDVSVYKSISSCKVSRVSVQPENKTSLELLGGNTSDLYFAIPSRPNCFLNGSNSYISMTYTVKGTTVGTAGVVAEISNGTGASFIKTLETIAGSTSIELINAYGTLGCLIDDFNSQSRNLTLGSILDDSNSTTAKAGFQRNIGSAGADGYVDKRRICIPLLSVAVGTLQDKYFPVGTDIGLRLRLTMEDPNIAIKSSVGVINGYLLEDITYEMEYLEVEPEIYRAIVAESGNVLKVGGTGISTFQSTIASGASQQTVLIPARYSSVKSFMTINQLQSIATGVNANSTGGRCRDKINSYVYRIFGRNYPNLPVVCDGFNSAETMCEVLKVLHGLHNKTQECGFNATSFVHNTDGAFCFGVNFTEAGVSHLSMGGLDTSSGNTFLDITYESGQSSAATIMTTFCFYDTIVEINTITGEVLVSR